uniref:Uncharacterized protein n=1 Tax=Ditylum brightwellii TaxID=49249 RepID=A0A7S4SYJ8_9STRA|mmetsp:Transcript_25173/g.33399  ORF Transcript_25173/g.33399 Transcript_25173/m.33399 type:complete len:149 (+) Transcript_25173:166-612(+)
MRHVEKTLLLLYVALLMFSSHGLSFFANTMKLQVQRRTNRIVYQNTSCGWTVSCNNSGHDRDKKTALSYSNSYQDKETIGIEVVVPPPSTIGAAMQTSDDFILEDQDFLEALEAARDADSKYGICSGPSKAAWEAVDSLYERKLAFGA